MFYGLENTQKEVASLIEQLIAEGNFPSAVLFDGPECSSRMYAALSVAKAFSSDIDSTVIVSDRNYSLRISAAIALFKKARNKASRNFLKENVTTFLKQFHGALLDSASAASKKKFSDAGECMDLLGIIDDISEVQTEAFCNKLEKSLSPLFNFSKGAVSVSQIRDIRDWCSTSSLDGKAKFVIIEGIENATDSASNALLKTLEEPPADTHFILISKNSGRIPATVLSRVRKFAFKPFGEEEKKYVLSSLFVNPGDFQDVESFYLSYSGVDDSLLLKEAKNLSTGKEIDIVALVKELEKSQAWDRFYKHLIQQIGIAFSNNIIDSRRSVYILKEIETAVNKAKAFNQVPRLTFDFVVFRTKEVLG